MNMKFELNWLSGDHMRLLLHQSVAIIVITYNQTNDNMNNYVLKIWTLYQKIKQEILEHNKWELESKLGVVINVVQVLFVHHQRFFVMISGDVLAISHSIPEICWTSNTTTSICDDSTHRRTQKYWLLFVVFWNVWIYAKLVFLCNSAWYDRNISYRSPGCSVIELVWIGTIQQLAAHWISCKLLGRKTCSNLHTLQDWWWLRWSIVPFAASF